MIKKSLLAVLWITTGGLLTLILVAVIHLESRPDLEPWHEVRLAGEFTADAPASDLAAYLAIEEKLFRQMHREVVDHPSTSSRGPIDRYRRGSLTDPDRWERNWNRTFELAAPDPVAGVLLLHGMSDSPYSLRAIGAALNAKGAHVLGLRLPGHGTLPSGLVHLEWEDMAAAVRLAMRHLHARLAGRPLFIVGYSVGGALAVHYVLDQIGDRDQQLPAVARIALISPAIGVTRLAALSVWQARLGRWLGLDKLAWHSIQPEYNSYKYSSFAINAGVQVHRLTTTLQQRLAAARRSGTLNRFVPVIVFQSVVDATVSTPAVLTGLLQQLPNPGNELILFDINRHAGVDTLMAADPLTPIMALRSSGKTSYHFRLVTNTDAASQRVRAMSWKAGAPAADAVALRLAWPDRVHSLSHIALPFPEDDPLYGTTDNAVNPGIVLSKTVLRGEKGVIGIPADEVLRLRWNPFYPYLSLRLIEFLGL